MLSFEVVNSGKGIQICIDRPGLAILLQRLEDLKTQGHVHLRTRSCGGNELDDKDPFGNPAVMEVIITTGGDDGIDAPT